MTKTVFVFSIITILFLGTSNFLLPDAYAKDYLIETDCIDGNWIAVISDEEGNPLKNVRIGTTKKFSTKSMEEKFYTDENGKVTIEASSNLGYVNISKGGYTDKVIETPCQKVAKTLPSVEQENFQGKLSELYIAKHLPLSTNYYITHNAFIAGDVVNLSHRPVTDIILSARTFKNGEVFMDYSFWYPMKKILRPGEASPFFMEPGLSGFDDYEISVSNYKFSDALPNEPSIDILELDVQRNRDEWDTYTIKCTDSGVYPTGLDFFAIEYDESGYIIGIDFIYPEYPNEDDCRLNGNKTSDFPYFDIPTDNSFEFFLIEGARGVLLTAGEPGGFYPIPLSDSISDTYSKYHPDSLRPKYMDEITKVESFLTSANLEVNKPMIIEDAPETNLPKLGTYNVLVHDMPKNWEKDYGTILDSSLKFWEENYDEIKFNYVNYWKDADFSIEWASTFSIEGKGLLGYYGCCDDYGANKVVITLGHFDEDNNWIFTERDYAEEILKHEIGHALGLKHTQNQDDIMYAYIYDYEKWQDLDKIKKELVTDESKPDMPDWIRNNAKWWADGKIKDEDFVSGIQYLIKEKIMQIPQTAKGPTSAAVKEIPEWIKNNADWWSQGLISDDDFVKGIQYLVEQGIIKV